MAECIECGLKVSWVDYPQGICTSCRRAANESQPSEKYDAKSNELSSHTVSESSTSAATAFTSLAWVIVTLTFFCTLIATFVTAVDGDAFSAMMMFIGGCFSVVLLGLLSEISTNIAKLVNNSS